MCRIQNAMSPLNNLYNNLPVGSSITAVRPLTTGSISMISGNNPFLSRPVNLSRPVSRLGKLIFFTSLFCVGLTATPTFAEEPEKDAPAWTINELMHDLAQVKESKVTFVERKYLSILKTPLEYSGTLAY